MMIFVLKPLRGPSLVLLSVLISVSVNINKADELSWCDQDADSFSLMQSANIGRNLVHSKAYIGASSVGASSHGWRSANVTTKVEALLRNKESRQSLVQRVSNKNQVAVVDSDTNFWIWLAVVLSAMAVVFCASYLTQQQDQRGQPDQKRSKRVVSHASPNPGEDSRAGAPFLENNSSRLQSPGAVHDNRSPRNFSPRLSTSPRQISLPPNSSLNSVGATPLQTQSAFGPAKVSSPKPLVPSLVKESGEIRVGVHHDRLESAGGTGGLDIIFATGQLYLRALLEASEQRGYSLAISTAPSAERVCSIVSPATTDPQSPYQILNSQGSQHGYFYRVATGSYEVVVQGASCYTIRSSPDNLRYQVLKENETVAFAQLNKVDFPGGEHVEFRILPGTDSVLIISILLGLALFSLAK